jgi:hypothetical protein
MKNILLLFFSITFSVKILAQVPTITDFNPKSATPGTAVTITGTNFSTTPANNIVFFGATKATVTAATATQLTVTVPNGATNQLISVTVSNKTGYSGKPFIPTYNKTWTSTVLIDDNSFSGAKSFAVANYPDDVVAVDLDGDGKPDLATANESNTVSTLLNTSSGGNISFNTKVDFTVSGTDFGTGIASGDLDGDGKKDIVTTKSYKSLNTVNVLRNTSITGNISFAAKIDVTTGANPIDAFIIDLDMDGKPELITQSNNGNNVYLFSVLRNTSTVGSISFAAPQNVTVSDIASITAADIDGDGKPELITANGASKTVSVFRNTSTTGNITFAAKVDLSSQGNPSSIFVSDLDGDAKVEIITGNYAASTISVFRNTSTAGSVSFATTKEVPIVGYGTSVFATDIDADAKPDLVVSNGSNSVISVFTNQSTSGTINFGTEIDIPAGGSIGSIFVADFDADGKPDVAGVGNNSISVFQNLLPTPPKITAISPTSGDAGTIVSISGNNFGITPSENAVFFGATRAGVISANSTDLQVIAPTGSTNFPITVTNLNTKKTAYGNSSFQLTFPSKKIITASSFAPKQDFPVSGSSGSVFVADLNNDSKPEIIANAGTILRNTSSVNSLSFTGTDVGNSVNFVSDLDGDGKLDLISYAYAVPGKASVMRNTSAGNTLSFAARQDFTVGDYTVDVFAADIDGDGKPDIISQNYLPGTVSILQNTTSGSTISFAAKRDFSIPNYFDNNVFLADLNNDGKPEIITADGASMSILRNTSTSGNFSFDAVKTFAGVFHFDRLFADDLDGDDLAEVIVVNGSTGNVSVYKNTTIVANNITFDAAINFSVGNSPKDIFVADIDSDSKPDLVATNFNGVSVLKNKSTLGNIAFNGKINFPGDGVPYGVFVADMDGDGKVDIITANLLANYVSVFRNQVLPLLPEVTSFSPVEGAAAGNTVTILGNNFSEITGITFNGITAAYTVNSLNQITATVPAGSASGKLIVANRAGTDTAAVDFIAIDPAGIITGKQAVCQGEKKVQFTIPQIKGASTYEWTLNGSVIAGATTNTLSLDITASSGTGDLKVSGVAGSYKGKVSSSFIFNILTLATPPSNLKAQILSSNSVILSWEDKSTNETQFYIYRSKGKDSAFAILDKRDKDLTSFTDNLDLQPNTTYYYQIAAANGDCLSAFSNIVGISTPPPVITALSDFSEKSITISPNPSDGIFEIVSERALSPKTEIWVSDALGKILWKETVKNSSESGKYTLNLQNIASGIYFLTIKTEKSNVTKKIIRQ